jgi:vitamin B12 transporter
MSHKKQLLSLFIASTFVTPVLADAAQQVALDDLVVTATRTSVASAQALASVSIITREDIEKYQYQTLAQAIQTLPGVVISNSGGLGKQTSLFLRGTESNHI